MKKKVILVSILVIVILVSALLVGYQYLGKSQYTIEPSSKYNKIQLKGAKLFIETDYLTEKEMQQIAKVIEEGIEDLDDYFGDKHNAFDLENQKISYFIKSGPVVSGARGSTVQLSYVKENRSPYIHETVRIMAGGV